jgi:hypothetical protein
VPIVADFHAYELTITAKVVIPADGAGNAATFDLNSLPNALRSAIEAVPALSKASVGLPVIVPGAPTEVTL